MNLDGLSMSVLARELDAAIRSGQIQKLYQIDKTTLLFKIRAAQCDKNLIVTVGANPAVYLGNPVADLPKDPSSLCMFLRKHLEGSRITEVKQINGDRIISIDVNKLEMDGSISTTSIYIELMGKYSNCIFVQDDIILESLIHVSPLMNRERSIGPKQHYELPPNANRVNLLDFTEKEIRDLLLSFSGGSVTDSIRTIFNGFGKQTLEELLRRSELDGTVLFRDLSDLDISRLAYRLYELGSELKGASHLYRYKTNDGKTFVSPLLIEGTAIEKTYPTLSSAIEESTANTIHTADKELEKIVLTAIKKEELRHQKIKDELDDTEKIDTYKLYGDLLMINAHLPTRYKTSIELTDLLSEEGETVVIPLKPQLTVVENAQWYYKMYTKLKNRMVSGRFQLEASNTKLEYYNTILYSLSMAKDRESLEEIRRECMDAGIIKKSKKPVSFKLNDKNYIHLTLPEGELYIGRNNRQNEYLTHRFAKAGDIWFHTQGIQGSHLILRPAHEPDDLMLSKVAKYAAYFSRARQSGKVAVDYTDIKNIKKPPGSPLGFVIFHTYQTMIVEPEKPNIFNE